jgi:hypothetical protein
MPKSIERPEASRMGRLLIALVILAMIVAAFGGRGFHAGG